jgi:hypothetical protein
MKSGEKRCEPAFLETEANMPSPTRIRRFHNSLVMSERHDDADRWMDTYRLLFRDHGVD